MSSLLASTMTCICRCRICKSTYNSLLSATSCCLQEKLASRRRKNTDSILKTGEVSLQSKLAFSQKGFRTDRKTFKERYQFWKSYLDRQ